MKIKICGLRDIENIREILSLGVDMIGFDFIESSPRYVRMIGSGAGFLPDYAHLIELSPLGDVKTEPILTAERTGVFADTMPQTIVTHVVNYHLDYVQLDGEESPVMIANLKRTLIPDLQPDIKVIKTLRISTESDFSKCQLFEETADMFRFEFHFGDTADNVIQLLKAYSSHKPYIVAGNIIAQHVQQLATAELPHCWGVELNEQFETAPAQKDAAAIKAVLNLIR